MKLSYDRATDSLYETGALVGLDIDHASRFVDEEMLTRRMIPIDLHAA